ncbi:hypothetical protein J2755_001770 [Methanohalophilus levihalophilus]|uniref:hypothetical protein n=1 Tax=Methanohalophilus levihalophilus TaxID=1431282 RepID=UPI001AE5AB82|nr:hypothetical protein [Methanohalophilus levihalophilus]MBP2030822.1 hypothetical protein [Methanohalophilus levihalophilus]
MKTYPDNFLKNQILNAVYTLNGSNAPRATSKNIRTFIKYNGSKSNFKSEIYGLKRRGYLSFSHESKNKKVKTYILTKKGDFHRLNPDYYQKLKAERIAATVNDILNDDNKFTAAVDNEVANRMDIIETNVANLLSSNVNTTNIGNEPISAAEMIVANIIAKKDEEIRNLNAKYFSKANPGTLEDKASDNSQQMPDKHNDEKRMEKRQNLANHYYQNHLWLDLQFFQLWKNMVPVLLSGRKGSL